MMFSTLQLYAPSLWFISAFGMAQINPQQLKHSTNNAPTKTEAQPSTPQKPSLKEKKLEKQLESKMVNTRATETTHKLASAKQRSCFDHTGTVSNVKCVIEAIQRNYIAANTVLSDFEQTYTYSVYQRTQTSKGKLFIKKPGKMRWDYTAPVPKVFVSNGQVLWVYEPNKGQAYQRSLAESELPIAIRFLTGQGDLLKDFTAQLGPVTEETITAVLKPKDAKTQYKTLALVVDKQTFMVKETMITDRVNNTNRVRFTTSKMNRALPDSGFDFVPPKGVKIIR